MSNEPNLVFKSNPQVQSSAIEPSIKKYFKPSALNLTGTTNAGATTLTLSATVPANNVYQYLSCKVSDGYGNEATGSFDVANIAGGATVTTSGLDAATDWLIQVIWAEPTSSLETPKFDSYDVTLTGSKGSRTITADTRETAGTLQVWVELWEAGAVCTANAAVADTGTAAFGNVAQNAIAYAKVTFKNTASGNKPLKVLTIADNGAAMDLSTIFGEALQSPLTVATGDTSDAYVIVNLTTSVLGAIAASSITITSNDPANPTYVVNFSATIV